MLSINEAEYTSENGHKGIVAVFIYSGDRDPRPILENAISKYTEGYKGHYIKLMDAHMDCPWVRVVVSEPDKMYQESLSDYLQRRKIDDKISDILN